MARGRGGGGGGADISVNVDVNSPAVVFAILHGLTLLIFATKALAEPTSVVLFLALFGAIRVAGLGMEAVVEDPNLGTLPITVASGALYDAGIFALLYAAYMLVLKRGAISGNVVKNSVTRITSNAHFFRLILVIGVIFGVSTWVCYFQAINNYDGRTQASYLKTRDLVNIAWDLQEVCVNTFLFATVLLAVQTMFVLSAERSRPGQQLTAEESPEAPYAKQMPFLIVVLLLVHGIYRTVSISLTVSQPRIVGYLVGVLSEWLAVLLFSTKGLIPSRKSVVHPAPEHGKEFVLA